MLTKMPAAHSGSLRMCVHWVEKNSATCCGSAVLEKTPQPVSATRKVMSSTASPTDCTAQHQPRAARSNEGWKGEDMTVLTGICARRTKKLSPQFHASATEGRRNAIASACQKKPSALQKQVRMVRNASTKRPPAATVFVISRSFVRKPATNHATRSCVKTKKMFEK